MYQVLTSMPRIGVPATTVFLADPPGKTSSHRRATGLLRRTRSRHTPLRLINPRQARFPRRQQAPQARNAPLCLRTSLRSDPVSRAH